MRIIHISDLHFGIHLPKIIEAFYDDLELLQPEVIIISGDLTQRAKPEQYQQVSSFLQNLKAPFLVVPGNHDIPFDNLISRFIYPFKRYTTHVYSELEANYSNEKVNILGVNTASPRKIKDGILNKKTLTRIREHFSSSSAQLNILFFHHNLKYFSGMHQPLKHAEEFLNYLKESPIHMVCTGHLHYANLELITKKTGDSCALLHAGSLSCPRTKDGKNSFYSITIEQLNCSIDWRVFVNNGFSSQQIHSLNFSVE